MAAEEPEQRSTESFLMTEDIAVLHAVTSVTEII